ncbi:MAG: HAD family hydrolase, partial [Muribaculaceae bacterium]|nr:HAD family hydrolase [Muribaculaceae bacterium]
MSTLFVSDLDGTMLVADRKVSSESVRLLNESISEGALFSVATARTPATVGPLLKDVDCRLPLIVMTGAAIWDRTGNRYAHASFHRESTVRRLISLYRRHGLSAFVYALGQDNVIHIYHIGEMSPLERAFMEERLATPYKRFHIGGDGISELPEDLDRILLFYSMRPTDEVRRVYEDIKDSDDLRAVFYHDMYGEEIALMEVFGPEASKANAVRILARMVGADRIVAYGDNINDLPIMKEADAAVAVE